jgi:hypothetical protein
MVLEFKRNQRWDLKCREEVRDLERVGPRGRERGNPKEWPRRRD